MTVEQILFWAVAATLAAGVAGVLVAALLRPGGPARAADRAAQVYRDQLAEIEADRARGVIAPREAEAMRAEVARRLLALPDAGDGAGAPAPRRANRLAALAVAVVVAGGGTATYLTLGAPAMPDRPLAERIARNAAAYAERPRQEQAEARAAERRGPPPPLPEEQEDLLAQLRAALESRPDDLRGHRLLTRTLAGAGRWAAAADAKAQVIEILGTDATAADHTDLAEFLILAAGGYVSPEAEAAIVAALARDPSDPRARYFSGLNALQAGRVDLTYELWSRLLAESRPGAPWIAPIARQIEDVAAAAGRPVPPIPGEGDGGPGAADIAAAADMTQEEREEMIRGMVGRLSDRLAREGGPAADWAQLIRALGVLGETARAAKIHAEAQETFAGDEGALARIERAGRAAGVAQ